MDTISIPALTLFLQKNYLPSECVAWIDQTGLDGHHVNIYLSGGTAKVPGTIELDTDATAIILTVGQEQGLGELKFCFSLDHATFRQPIV